MAVPFRPIWFCWSQCFHLSLALCDFYLHYILFILVFGWWVDLSFENYLVYISRMERLPFWYHWIIFKNGKVVLYYLWFIFFNEKVTFSYLLLILSYGKVTFEYLLYIFFPTVTFCLHLLLGMKEIKRPYFYTFWLKQRWVIWLPFVAVNGFKKMTKCNEKLVFSTPFTSVKSCIFMQWFTLIIWYELYLFLKTLQWLWGV